MKKRMLFVAAFLILANVAFAQNDPGLPDSIIIGTAVVDSGTTSVTVPVFFRTDDSVAFYNLPLACTPRDGGVSPDRVTQYFVPVSTWIEHFDSLVQSDSFIREIGWAYLSGDSIEQHVLLYTHYGRVNGWMLRFAISPDIHPQTIRIDTLTDSINGPVFLGLNDGVTGFTPAFKYGEIIIPATGIDDDGVIPQHFSLRQNYPNPFNPSTNIEFTLTQPGFVSLEIYDILGQQIKRLVGDNMDAGRYSIKWDGKNELGSEVPSGAYFYKLTAADFSNTKKMLLIR